MRRRTGRRGCRREEGGRRRSGRNLWSPGPGRTPGPGSAQEEAAWEKDQDCSGRREHLV